MNLTASHPHTHRTEKRHGSEKSDTFQKAETLLRTAKMKVTQPRIAILAHLIHSRIPLTVEEIFQLLKKRECDLVTVYRCVNALEKAALVSRCVFGDGLLRFEFSAHSNSHHQHHVICNECRTVEPLEVCVDQIWKSVLNQKGYTELSHSLEFSGLCPSCKGSP